MEEVPDLGPAPRRLTVDVETVRRLVADQFPQLGAPATGRPVQSTASTRFAPLMRP